MAPPTPRALGRRLRRLDRAGLARFVAALWAASGWSAAVEDGRVVAHRAPPSRQRRVLAVATGLADGLAGVTDEADQLVAPVGERAARLLATRTGLAVVDADELHERLVYAVDGEAREHLLGEFVPAARPGPSRRAVLSALAVGGAAAAVAGVAARGPGSLPLVSRLRSAPSGERPTATGTATATAATDSPVPTTTPAPSPTAGCEGGPEEAVAMQVGTLRRELAAQEGTVPEAEKPIGYDFTEATDAFVDAVEDAGMEPFRNAATVDVGTALDQGSVAIVPVTVVTERDEEVLYEFTLTYTRAGCWRTAGAELVVRRTPEQGSVGQV